MASGASVVVPDKRVEVDAANDGGRVRLHRRTFTIDIEDIRCDRFSVLTRALVSGGCSPFVDPIIAYFSRSGVSHTVLSVLVSYDDPGLTEQECLDRIALALAEAASVDNG